MPSSWVSLHPFRVFFGVYNIDMKFAVFLCSFVFNLIRRNEIHSHETRWNNYLSWLLSAAHVDSEILYWWCFPRFPHSPPHIALWIYTIENDMICPCGQKCTIEIEMQVIQSCPGCWKLIFIKYMQRIGCDITTSSVKGQLWFVIVYHERYSTFCIVVQTCLSRLKRTLSGSYEIFNESSVCSWRETQWSENSTGISLRKCLTWMQ